MTKQTQLNIKTEILPIVKSKQNVIAWWLLLPAVLIMVQLTCLVVADPPKSQAQGEVAVEQSAAQGKPEVLGATTDIRGQQPEDPVPVVADIPASTLGEVNASSFLAYDQDTGKILLEREGQARVAIASLTKLMTGLLAYENLDFNQTIKINKQGLTSVHPTVGFIDGDEVKVGDVFEAMIVGSCNDAAQVLGRAITEKTGRSVIDLMNEKAKELGMVNTNYANPIGFDSAENYSTAEDLQKLIEATQKFAVFTNLGRTISIDFKGNLDLNYHATATNTLLKTNQDIYAVKTGFTQAAQGAMVTKVMNNGHPVVIVVLESQNREKDTLLLKDLVANQVKWQ